MDIVRSHCSPAPARQRDTDRAARRRFFGVSATLFAITSAVTIVGCTSMSSMGEMPMPGGWTMSMTWTKMPGDSWANAGASFVGMWIVMMKAMMLPSLTPMLWRYRLAVAGTNSVAGGHPGAGDGFDKAEKLVTLDDSRLRLLVMLVGAGYFLVWALYGVAIFGLGTALAAVEMQWPALSRAVPFASGLVMIGAGAMQFTAWKTHHLICCREAPGHGRRVSADATAALRHGLRLGMHCGYCTAGLSAVLLVLGVMDLRVMAVVTIAITIERLAPDGVLAARVIGVITTVSGLLWLVHAAGLA